MRRGAAGQGGGRPARHDFPPGPRRARPTLQLVPVGFSFLLGTRPGHREAEVTPRAARREGRPAAPPHPAALPARAPRPACSVQAPGPGWGALAREWDPGPTSFLFYGLRLGGPGTPPATSRSSVGGERTLGRVGGAGRPSSLSVEKELSKPRRPSRRRRRTGGPHWCLGEEVGSLGRPGWAEPELGTHTGC